MPEDRWFSVDEIAEYLGVKRDTLYKWIARKQMPAHKVGRLWKFNEPVTIMLKLRHIRHLKFRE